MMTRYFAITRRWRLFGLSFLLGILCLVRMATMTKRDIAKEIWQQYHDALVSDQADGLIRACIDLGEGRTFWQMHDMDARLEALGIRRH